MDERTDAKRSIESSTKHLTEIAHELSRRASPRYLGDQAKETALNKSNEWKEQLSTSPLALGIIGGTIGALIGRALGKERLMHASIRSSSSPTYRTAMADERGVRYGAVADTRGGQYGSGSEASWGNGSNASGSGIGDKIVETAHDLRDKAGEMAASVRDRTGEMVGSVRDQIPSAAEIGHKADENPMLVALGGLALGAIAAFLLPVSRQERQLLEPVKQRAGEAIESLGDKLGEGMQQAREKIAGPQDQPQPQTQQRALGEFTVSGGLPSQTH